MPVRKEDRIRPGSGVDSSYYFRGFLLNACPDMFYIKHIRVAGQSLDLKAPSKFG